MAKVKEFMQLPTDLLYRILDTTIQKAHCNEHNMRTIDIAAALKATLVSKAFYEYIISQLRLALNRKFAIHEKISTSIPSGRCICFERISLVTEQRTKEAVELLVWFKHHCGIIGYNRAKQFFLLALHILDTRSHGFVGYTRALAQSMDNFRGASTLPQQDDGLEAAKKARADLSTREANRRSLQAIHDTPAAGIRVMRHERTRNKYEDRNSEDKDPSEMTSEDRAMHLLEPVGSGGLPGKVGIVTKQAYKTMNVVSAPIPR